MARDGKQLLKFSQQTFAAATNQLQTNNYAMGATASTGALIFATSAGTAGYWYAGTTNAFNRSAFRDMQADQSVLVSGEVSAIAGDPAIYGQTETAEQGYIRFAYAPFGPLNTSSFSFEIIPQAASDSGSGTAGSDWTQIGDSQPVSVIASYPAKTATSFASGTVTLAAHGFVNGQIITMPSATATGFTAGQPMFVVNAQTNTFDVALAPYAPKNTGLSASGTLTIHYSGTPRIQVVTLSPTPKPWVRLAFRAIPAGNAAFAQYAGCWIDNVGLTVGRDVPALI